MSNKVVLLVLSGLLGAPLLGQGHYTIRVRVSPATSELRADAVFRFPVAAGTGQLKFVLNKGLRITSAGCDVCTGSSFEPSQPGGAMYAPSGAPLVFAFRRPLAGRQFVRFRVRYEGKIASSGLSAIRAGWVELALYSAWFPYNSALGRFTYDMRLDIDPAYKVAGAGDVKALKPGAWDIHEARDTFDIVVVASPRLESRSVSGANVRLASVGLDNPTADAVVEEIVAIVNQLGRCFGSPMSERLTVVMTPREEGGGYSRPGLVVYSTWVLKGRDRLVAGLAHEIAHLWWIGAPVDTWEDWLNEGFAEYSSLMMVRERLGNGEFERQLARYEQDARGTPAIWGIKRQADEAYVVLYEKGALVLHRLEVSMGREAFRQFLAALANTKTRSVEAALQVLSEVGSQADRERLERMLRE